LAREAELRAADATLRPLLLRKYALENEVTAMEAATKAAEDAAAAQKAIMDERYGLETQWLELIGDKATLRARELEKLDPSNRQLQQNIWDLQDAQEAAAKAAEAAAQAQQDYADALASARDVLSQAYERESSALQQTIDKFRGFADTIAEFRRGLFASDNPAVAFGAAQDQFLKTSRNAAFGNEPSLQAFVGDAQAYLDAAKNNAGSLLEYQRIVAQVAVASRRAESGANGVANEAQRQLDLMTEQVKGILDLNENVVSFGDALAAYTEVQAQGIPVISDTIAKVAGIPGAGSLPSC